MFYNLFFTNNNIIMKHLQAKSILIALICILGVGSAVSAARPAKKRAKAKATSTVSVPYFISEIGGVKGYYLAAYGRSFDNLKYGILDSLGNLITPKFSESLTLGKSTKGYFLIVPQQQSSKWVNFDGSLIRNFPNTQTTPIGEDLIFFQVGTEYSKSGLMDVNGKVLIPNTEGISFNQAAGENVIAYKNGTMCGIVNRKGETVVDFIYDCIGTPTNGWIAAVKNGKAGYIDMKGKVMVPFIYDYDEYWGEDGADPLPMYAVNGVGIVCKDGKWGAVDANGKTVIPFVYSNAAIGSKGTIAMYDGINDMREYYFDSTGRLKGKLQQKGYTYGDVDDLHPYMSPTTDKCGYVNSEGRLVIPAIYTRVSEFNGPTALVKKGGVWMLINRQGQVVKRNVARYNITELVG